MEPFSGIGDIVVLIRVAYNVYSILSTAIEDAPRQVRELVDEVETLRKVLRATERTLELHSTILWNHDDVQGAISDVLRSCYRTLKDLEEVGSEYNVILRRDGGRALDDTGRMKQWTAAFKKVYLQIRWTSMDDTVAHIRQLLRSNLDTLSLMADNLQLHNIGELRSMVEQVREMLKVLMLHAQPTPSIPLDGVTGNRHFSIADSAYFSDHEDDITNPPALALRGPFNQRTPSLSPSIGTQRLPSLSIPSPQPSRSRSSSQVSRQTPETLTPRSPTDAISFEERDLDLSLFSLTSSDRRSSTSSSRSSAFNLPATVSEQAHFLSQLPAPTETLELSLVKFIYRRPNGLERYSLSACGSGLLHLPALWSFSTDSRIRLHHLLSRSTIPYILHGRTTSVILKQQSMLHFHLPTSPLMPSTTVPSSWVEYIFPNAKAADRFQEVVYGQRLLLTVGVDNVFWQMGIGHSDRTIVGREGLRLWRDCDGKVWGMVRLAPAEGWREWGVWELRLCEAKKKSSFKVRLKHVCMRIEKESRPVSLERQETMLAVDGRRASVVRSLTSVKNGRSDDGVAKQIVVEDILIMFSTKKGCEDFYRVYLNNKR